MQSEEENNVGQPQRKNFKSCRVVIYPKDIQLLTGKSYRHALYLNKEIRDYFKKKKHQLLTIYEFADYTGISPDIIRNHIK
ncbi:hypothetical protein POV26_03565 [Aequorivita todarodis]|uniref:hypothetical protein n=1 Tax=Aequorivita todarodis TaxID=2036821 RepID=UPI00235105FE|nr:hypothetical protein [Aequorivita todarodis]MDC8000101.1 hypothetical protein [Aequorivita todarodis]